ncbi:uncharacterized protein DFL_009672 [Arthrobotrys flagrans]|uniref:Uncharacterized protein n=1 Tax=Arthrobotrys flagrans TaxID=97331 RepID=A0A436ZSF4_ARTFL|nr:hypothetical protein DFL_009672 [Arthrobotrys flagrans]
MTTWGDETNAQYRDLKAKWEKKGVEGAQLKAVLWGFSLNCFRWYCKYHQGLRAITSYKRREVRLAEPSIFDDPLVLDELQSAKVDAMWRSHTEWPLHMGSDGTFALDKSARSGIEGIFEALLVDEPLKMKIWEEVGSGSPWPVRRPRKRTREYSSSDPEVCSLTRLFPLGTG